MMFMSLPMVPSLNRLETCWNNQNQTKINKIWKLPKLWRGESTRNIYKYVGFNFTKYRYNITNSSKLSPPPPNNITWLHLLFNPHKKILWFLAVLERRGWHPDCLPYHVHNCEDVRGHICLAVLFHHFPVCYHKGLHVEARCWLSSWSSGPPRAPVLIEPEIGVLCGRLGGVCNEQKSIRKGYQYRTSGWDRQKSKQGEEKDYVTKTS